MRHKMAPEKGEAPHMGSQDKARPEPARQVRRPPKEEKQDGTEVGGDTARVEARLPETKAENPERFVKRGGGGRTRNDLGDRRLKYLDPRLALKAAESRHSGWENQETPPRSPGKTSP
ncbi:hypothetical protein JRQ81_012103 [Phrynocephalus forsythii]|uniref:Uncharacterized protein n=1 Tax=Phrynocephalus forsythii TaxID=171643 RepID=A0A9Q0X5L2_9SAUR|nr:hypothetical protein JRQ81_012103 [Phrynocephalus forsythii]